MGYSTDFYGTVKFNRPLTPEIATYINRFSHNRHMTRDPDIIKQMDPKWTNHCWKGDLGPHGIFYTPPEVMNKNFVEHGATLGSKQVDGNLYSNPFGQMIDISVVKDIPPEECPGYWCQWIINQDGELEWDGGEKFYEYTQWLEFLIKYFFEPEGYILNGSIDFQGEDRDDAGTIYVTDNIVTIEYLT